MGNETSGFAVLNLSSYNLHIGLSMAATHYYENNVKHGEIFYRWPGAVHYTVFAQTAPELSDGTCATEITKATVLGVTLVGSTVIALPALTGSASSLVLAADAGAISLASKAVADNAIVKEFLDVLATVPTGDSYAEMKGCYSGGSGTWLVLRGGLQGVNGEVKHEKLRLEEVTPEYVLGNGKFTAYSNKKFYTTKEAKKHIAAGHSCRRAACKLLS